MERSRVCNTSMPLNFTDITLSHSETIDGTCLTEDPADLEEVGRIASRKGLATWREVSRCSHEFFVSGAFEKDQRES
ncbi:hypothetical protein TNIN_252641, partial [Trichonephila inaurata madagascariensis]